MPHESVTDEIREQAALHALGLLEPEQARAFERHLESCPTCAAELRALAGTAAELPLALPAAAPDPALRQKLLHRVAPQPTLKDHVMRASGGKWAPTGLAGVDVKQLFANSAKDEVTMLMRMTPGATFPAHRHAGPEQCYVLEGEVRIGDLVLRAGDYGCAPADTIHPVTTSPLGCLLLIISSGHDAVVV